MAEVADLDYGRRARLQGYQRNTARIATGADHWQFYLSDESAGWPEFVGQELEKRGLLELIHLVLAEPTGKPVYSRVENNRWIASCECAGAEGVDPGESRFFCLNCLNAGNGNYSRPIVWPHDKDEIEDILLARGDPLTRGFTPVEAVEKHPHLRTWGYEPETAGMLEAENVLHSLPRKRSQGGGD